MLTATDIHLLVGVLTQVSSPEHVEIELGSTVYDAAREGNRDVDITVTFRDQEGSTVALHGIEVKRHGRPLTVEQVEQLCVKLKDMPGLTGHALVSASGYTGPARKKARHHGLQLYHLREVSPDSQPTTARDPDSTGTGVALAWPFGHIRFEGTAIVQRIVDWDTYEVRLILEGSRKQDHSLFSFSADALLREPAAPGAGVPFGRWLDGLLEDVKSDSVSSADGPRSGRVDVDRIIALERPCEIVDGDRAVILAGVHVQGVIVVEEATPRSVMKALIREDDQKPIAGCVVVELASGNLIALLVSDNTGALVGKVIPVSDRNNEKIRRLKLERRAPRLDQ